jgi:Mor family transcriptional regulator
MTMQNTPHTMHTHHTPRASVAQSASTDDVVNIIQSEARAVAASFGASAAVSDAQAAALVDRLLLRLGGGQWYMPKTNATKKREVHDWVRKNWKGNNLDELAAATGLCKRWIRKLVAGVK